MYTPIKIKLGPLSAEEDDYFEKHFLETKYFKRLMSDESDIVYGAKGVGKTALRKALTEINNEFYYKTYTIDLKSISFSAVYHNLMQVNMVEKTEVANLARTTWQDILINYALLAFSETLADNSALKSKLIANLKEDGIIDKINPHILVDSNKQLLNAIENIFHKAAKVPLYDDEDKRNKFVSNLEESRDSILKNVIKLVTQQSNKILICLDGFDSIVDYAPEPRRLILAGLIDAIFKFRLDKEISKAFCFKAFLPYELTLDAKILTWDRDKHLYNIHYIRWTEDDFKEFVEKRLAVYSKKKSTKFADIWNEFMPEKVFNNIHGVEENTFDYIIRHSLYRPRQVLYHIQQIFTGWAESNGSSEKIISSFIRTTVAKSNLTLADDVTDQIYQVYPQILNFLKSWQGSPIVIEVKKFRDKMMRIFELADYAELDKVFDDLFNFGIFGVHRKLHNVKLNQKRIKFRFSYVGDQFGSRIHNSIDDTDLLAFSPMFKEYCGLLNSTEGIIIPIAVDNFEQEG